MRNKEMNEKKPMHEQLVDIWDNCPYIGECEFPPSFCLKCKKVKVYEEKKNENVP